MSVNIKKTIKLFRNIAKIISPPPKLTVSKWADTYRRLSPEASAEPGQWRTERTPYLREIMDSVNNPSVETVVVMASSQVGKSELLLNTLGYYIDYDPAPILMIQPTDKLAQAFSKDRIATMIRDTPTIKDKVKDEKSRDSGNTILHKKFSGGHLTLIGANAPADLASRPIRIILADEVDRYPVSAGKEGDPINLAEKRTTTFWNKKKLYVSTPTIKGASRIEAEYEDSTMEQYCYKCPSCGDYQPLTWGQVRFDDVTMGCRSCREHFGEFVWKKQPAKWKARKEHNNKRGFHLNELYSPWKRWGEIISDFKTARAQGMETYKVWINTSLGESWEEQGESADEDTLIKRREMYNAELPDGIVALTAGADVQKDRIEIEVVGWGVGKESWGIKREIIYGDPEQPQIWMQLDEFLEKEWEFADKTKLRISCACIDSGYKASHVYKFTKPREHRRVYAIKGQGGEKVKFRGYIGVVSRNNRLKAALFNINVDDGKEVIMSRLKVDSRDKAGYCHFPIEKDRGYDDEYFRGLTSEKRVMRYRNGRPYFEWVKKAGTRNEPLDLRNYATAALEIFNPPLEKLKKEQKKADIYDQKPQHIARKTPKRRILSKGVTL